MVFRLLSDATLAVHLAFVVFVIGGGLFVGRWPRLAWAHLPAAAWGVGVECAGWVCPLTPLENWLRLQAGGPAYSSSFIEQYLLPLIYPSSLSRELQCGLGGLVLLVNAFVYVRVLRNRARKSAGAPAA